MPHKLSRNGVNLMNEYKISVIIPFFNTPLDLFDRCIESLLKQTFKDYEILIIDDGSSADYANHLEQKCVGQRNVRIFHTANRGVSKARNLGLKESKADNICFIDSDDYVAPWMLEDMYIAKVDTGADICVSYLETVKDFNYRFSRNYSVEILDRSRERDKNFLNEIILRGMNIERNKCGYLSCGPCSILVDSRVAKQIDFPDDIKYMEDVIWNYEVFGMANKVAKLQETLYAYFENSDSATHVYKQSVIDERIKALIEMQKVLELNEDAMQWYALRILCNFSMIYYQYGHVSVFAVSELKRAIEASYKTTYAEPWDKILVIKRTKNWEFKYKLKFILYKIRFLPIICVIRQLLRA